jgi:WS/DGAT/MGAT family acyltransferase
VLSVPFLSPLDAAWLYVETAATPMHVASLQIYSPPAGAPDDYVGRLLAEFREAREFGPPWNRKLADGLVDRLLPSWTVDEALEVDYHVRHSALPRPGGERELGILVSRLHSHPLDLTRPLWECHFIEGLQGGRFAVYTKMHHSMIDGVSGMRLLQRMLSTDPDERGMPAPWAARQPAASGPDPSHDTGEEGWNVGSLVEVVREQAGSLGNVGTALMQMVGKGDSDPLIAPLTCPWSVVNGRITPHRRLATQRVPLSEMKALARSADCTLNDVVLAMCASALRRYLLETDALPDEPLVGGLPVNVRPADDEGLGTAISFVCANLGTHVDDPRERLSLIRASTARAKQHLQALPRSALTHYTVTFMAPYILQLLTGLGGRLRPVFNLTISNVAGPDRPLYLNGARLEAMYPMSLLSHGQALNITCLSYDGMLHFGFTGCRNTLPHMQRLAVYTGDALRELQRAFEPTQPAATRRRAASRKPRRPATPAGAAPARAATTAGPVRPAGAPAPVKRRRKAPVKAGA